MYSSFSHENCLCVRITASISCPMEGCIGVKTMMSSQFVIPATHSCLMSLTKQARRPSARTLKPCQSDRLAQLSMLSKSSLDAVLVSFATGCWLLAACVSAQESPRLLLQGRFGGNVSEATGLGSPPLIFSWPASSVYAAFEGDSVNATLTALPPTLPSSGRYAFYLDQAEISVETISPTKSRIDWGLLGLRFGSHNLTITKLSEAGYGEATLDSLTLGQSGRRVLIFAAMCTLRGRLHVNNPLRYFLTVLTGASEQYLHTKAGVLHQN